MSARAGLAAVRSGPAKSCAECRRRKIRCVRPLDGDNSQAANGLCSNCAARGKTCTPQEDATAIAGATQPTARDRISLLEAQVAALTAVVKEKHPEHSSDFEVVSATISRPVRAADDPENRSDGESERCPKRPRLLLNRHVSGRDDGTDSERDQTPSGPSRGHIPTIRARLQALLPSKDEIGQVANSKSAWISLCYAAIRACSSICISHQLTVEYDRVYAAEVHSVSLARFLLSVAAAAQQVSPEEISSWALVRGGVNVFIDNISHAVEETVVANNAVIDTVEGLEITLGFVALQLERGDFRTSWLSLRRAIAVAELMGLPHAADDLVNASTDNIASHEAEVEDLRRKAQLWSSICAIDRISAMALKLTAGTGSYLSPQHYGVIQDGRVCPQAYVFRLSDICLKIRELESYSLSPREAEGYEKVLRMDQDLRGFAALLPRSWWKDYDVLPLSEQLIQFWHNYLLARCHLKAALCDDVDDQYGYSRTVCHEACTGAVARFLVLRPLLPSGSVFCRITDSQAFTAAAILLISSHSVRGELELHDDLRSLHLVHQIVDTFKLADIQSRTGFARDAVSALTSIHELFAKDDAGNECKVTLQIPFLGKIVISRPSRQSSMTPKGHALQMMQPPLEGASVATLGDGVAVSDVQFNSAPWSFSVQYRRYWLENLPLWEVSTAVNSSVIP